MWKQEIIDKQCESTKKLMLAQNARPMEDDSEYISLIRFTPIAKEAQCLKEDGTVDLNVRELSQQEADFHNGVRQKRGSIISELRRDKPVSTLTDGKRERAQSAFMRTFSLAALKERFKKIMGDVFKPTYAEMMAEAMRKKMEE